MESRRKDITGLRSGKLTAIEPTEQKRNGATLWRCRCDCGGEILLEPYQITGQKVKSCGCLRREKKLIDLTGQRFGRLTALERLDEKSGRSYLWRCRFDCGRETKVRASALTSGNTTSCGCGQHPSAPLQLHYIDGTYVELLEKTDLRKNNTSGHTGVRLTERGWRAEIWFKRRRYYLGTYRDYEQAVKARDRAKEEIHGSFLEWFYETFPEQKKKKPPRRCSSARMAVQDALCEP